MSKRHFESVARILRDEYSRASNNPTQDGIRQAKCAVCSIAQELATLFAQENPRFDRTRFLTACGVDDVQKYL